MKKKLPVLKVQLMPVTGFSLTKISLDGNNFEDVNFEISTGPFIGIGANIVVPNFNEKLSLLINAT